MVRISIRGDNNYVKSEIMDRCGATDAPMPVVPGRFTVTRMQTFAEV
jgi:hypothetical protein